MLKQSIVILFLVVLLLHFYGCSKIIDIVYDVDEFKVTEIWGMSIDEFKRKIYPDGGGIYPIQIKLENYKEGIKKVAANSKVKLNST